MAISSLFVSLLAASVALAQSSAYGQCGGMGWAGATTCVSGYTCTYSNPYYSQCLPGTASTTSSKTTSTTTSSKTTTTTSSTTTSTTTSSKTSTTPTSTTTTSTSAPTGAVSVDFESTPGSEWGMFITAQSGGSATIVTTKAHSGSHSLEVVSSGGYSNHVFYGLSSLSAVGLAGSGDLFGRYYANFANAFTQDHTTHMSMTDPVAQALRMGGQFTVLDWNRASDDSIMPDGSPQSNNGSVVIAANTWYCIEFHLGRSSGQIETWVNGNAVASLTTPQTRWGSSYVPNPSDWGVGWESYGGAANTIYYDDLALATSRIGC